MHRRGLTTPGVCGLERRRAQKQHERDTTVEPVVDVRSTHRSLSQVTLQKLRFTPVRAQPTSIRSTLEEYESRNSAARDH